MVDITAVIITKNEEEYIKRCINSLQDVVEEIIVFDSYSEDETKSICTSNKKVRFFEHAFDDYAAQKNRANEKAKCTYILSLDADEYLSKDLQKEIKRIKGVAHRNAYRFPRLNFIGQKAIKHGIWSPDKKIRLFKKGKAKWVGTGVHETLLVEGNDVQDVSAQLLHTVFNHKEEFDKKFDHYSTLWAEEKYRMNRKSSRLSPYIHATWTCIKGLIFKLAFLDGMMGILLLKAQSKESFKKHRKLHRLNKNGRF